MDKEVMECMEEVNSMSDDGDDGSCCIDISPSRLHLGAECLQPYRQDPVELLPDWKGQGLKKPERSKGSQVTDSNKQKTSSKAKPQTLKQPPIKATKAAKQKVQSAMSISVLELKNQLLHLQQQLKEARNEKKMQERLLHRHTVALKHYRESENGISQILINHSNDTRALKELLHETRVCRDRLARQLQAAENKLLNTQSNLQHLQLLNQEHSLLGREELTQRLAMATAELEEKDKKLADMKKNLELCQASFKRQILLEQRHSKEARRTASDLQEDKYQLTKELKDREKELEKFYIYSQKFLKASGKKGRRKTENTAENLLETQCQITDDEDQNSSGSECSDPVPIQPVVIKNQQQQVSANIQQHQSDLRPVDAPKMSSQEENTETYSDTREGSFSDEGSENQTDGDCDQLKELLEDQERSGEKEDNENTREGAHVLKKSPDATQLQSDKWKPPKTRHNYVSQQSVENDGRPVYSGMDSIPCGSNQEKHDGGDLQQ